MKKTILFGLTAFLLTFSLQSLFAQRFWISATPSNWNNTANWSLQALAEQAEHPFLERAIW
jgi:thiosulfate reductase cytochrome b subunit